MAILDKSAILSKENNKTIDVYVEPWEGDVRIKRLGVEDQIKFEKLLSDKVDHLEVVHHILLSCCVDEKGNKLFEKEDIPRLNDMSPEGVLFVFNKAVEFNYVTDVEVQAKAKNS